MTTEASAGDERARQLMMSALDGELGPDERREFERLLEEDPGLRSEWDRLRRVKEVTEQMSLRRPPDEVWDGYWGSVYRRLERGVAWILISVGAIIVVSYGAWRGVSELIADAELPWPVKGGVLAVTVGLVVLFVSVVREKLFVRRRDPYKDVRR
jgi:ferric-dicitrate binding protein FerR (iron transport regulator)